MIVLEKDISESGLDGIKLQCKFDNYNITLNVSGTAMSKMGMEIDDSMDAKTNIINNLLWRELARLDDNEVLQEINIDSEKIIFITNLGKKTFINE